MPILPFVGAALAGAVTGGVLAKVAMGCSSSSTNNEQECLGGSSHEYLGVIANNNSCRCPPGLAWDRDNNRCTYCPTETLYDINVDDINFTHRGCKCNDGYYNTTTKQCVSCITKEGYNYSDEKCCKKEDGSMGIKDGKCTKCLDNSSTNTLNNTTSVQLCSCNGGYIFSNGKCVQCSDSYSSSYGKCCPDGSNLYGIGKEIKPGCYCLPYHTSTDNGSCVYTEPSDIYVTNIITSANQDVLTLSKMAPYDFAYESINGVSEYNNIGIILYTKDASVFIKNIIINYVEKNSTTVKEYSLPNFKDVFITSFLDTIVNSIDSTWTVKSITINIINMSYLIKSVTLYFYMLTTNTITHETTNYYTVGITLDNSTAVYKYKIKASINYDASVISAV